MTRQEIVAEARRYLGAPWRRHGRSIHGIDCGGLPFVVGVNLGEQLQDIEVAQRRVPDGQTLVCLARNLLARPAASMLAIGAVALFVNDQHSARHVGIIAGSPARWTLINAHAGHRRVIEEPLTADMISRLVATFDFKTVNHEQ